MKLLCFLLCDDIRNEMGNKMSLIGLYDESIEFNITPEMINKWPKAMKIACVAKFSFEDNDKSIKSFKLKTLQNSESNEIAKGNLQTEKILELKRFTIAVVISNYIFKQAGEIEFKFEFYDDKDKIVKEISPEFKLKVSEKIITSI